MVSAMIQCIYMTNIALAFKHLRQVTFLSLDSTAEEKKIFLVVISV